MDVFIRSAVVTSASMNEDRGHVDGILDSLIPAKESFVRTIHDWRTEGIYAGAGEVIGWFRWCGVSRRA
jgi:hypothetical protein